jgi:hypothetical protein
MKQWGKRLILLIVILRRSESDEVVLLPVVGVRDVRLTSEVSEIYCD